MAVGVQVYRGYLSLLAEASPPEASAADGDTAMEEDVTDNSAAYSLQDSRMAWRRRTLAALGAFLRRHYMNVAPVASQIEQEVTEGTSSDVKEVVMRNLEL